MNWKAEAIEKLQKYTAMKTALTNIPEDLARLESAMQSIRSATADSIPVQGGGSGREERILSNIVQREELSRNLKQAQLWVQEVDAAWSILTDDERLILDRFYIHPERSAADRLAGDLGFDIKTVYRRKKCSSPSLYDRAVWLC